MENKFLLNILLTKISNVVMLGHASVTGAVTY